MLSMGSVFPAARDFVPALDTGISRDLLVERANNLRMNLVGRLDADPDEWEYKTLLFT